MRASDINLSEVILLEYDNRNKKSKKVTKKDIGIHLWIRYTGSDVWDVLLNKFCMFKQIL